MRLSWFRPLVLLPACLACAAACNAAPVRAQTHNWSTFGIGYVANAPTMMTGGGAYVLFPFLKGFGLYANATFDMGSPARKSDFVHMTAQEVQDSVSGNWYQVNTDSWQSFNVAVVKPITPGLMVYVGTGYAKKRIYDLFKDPSLTIGQGGNFWAEDTRLRESTVGLIFGGFLRMGRHLAFQMGVDTRPVGFTVGGLLKFPGR
jgi:hypothetical protein